MNQAQGLLVTCVITLVLFFVALRLHHYCLEQWRKTRSQQDLANVGHAKRMAILLGAGAAYALVASLYVSLTTITPISCLP